MRRVILLCAALCACGRTALTRATPHAVVDTRVIDFGATPVLFPVQRTVLVINAGRVALRVSAIAVEGAGFENPGPATLEVAGGSTAQLPLIFRPSATGDFQGLVTFATDDADLPSATVQLKGTGTETGALTVSPAAIDFGRVGEGQTATRQLTLSSKGPADLFVGALSASPDSFGFIGSIQTPATLAAGADAVLAVRFSPRPDVPGESGTLVIDSSDVAHPRLEVPVTGSINRAPIAVAAGSVNGGAASTGVIETGIGATIALDASASNDPDGDLPLTYAWALAARPDGSAAALTSATGAQSSLHLDAAGIYSVQLTATDATGLPSFSPSRLDIRAVSAQNLVVELVWDQVAPDLDLHFLQQGAALQSAGDCWWANPDPPWGAHHDGDKLTGYGPESVQWAAPIAGTYSVQVVYSASHGAQNAATNAQVRIYAQGVLTAALTHAFARPGEVWNAGTVDWPSGRVGATP